MNDGIIDMHWWPIGNFALFMFYTLQALQLCNIQDTFKTLDTDTGIFHLGSTHLQELEVRHGAVVNNRVEKNKIRIFTMSQG